MRIIIYNSAVAKRCGKNGIIKAVLINYIFNYHKPNIRKGQGHPANIVLQEFINQYTNGTTSLWKRSFIHEILKSLEKERHILVARENNRPVYSLSKEMANLLTDERSTMVSFDLELACTYGIYVAIMARYLLYVIERSPKGEAYNLKVDEMAEINRISPAQIYRAIKYLVDTKVLRKVKSPLKFRSRALSLAKYKS